MLMVSMIALGGPKLKLDVIVVDEAHHVFQ